MKPDWTWEPGADPDEKLTLRRDEIRGLAIRRLLSAATCETAALTKLVRHQLRVHRGGRAPRR